MQQTQKEVLSLLAVKGFLVCIFDLPPPPPPDNSSSPSFFPTYSLVAYLPHQMPTVWGALIVAMAPALVNASSTTIRTTSRVGRAVRAQARTPPLVVPYGSSIIIIIIISVFISLPSSLGDDLHMSTYTVQVEYFFSTSTDTTTNYYHAESACAPRCEDLFFHTTTGRTKKYSPACRK